MRNSAAQANLRASAEGHRSLFEHMLDGYAYCRMLYEDGVPKDFIYLEVNPAFERLTGLKNVVGRKVSEVIPGLRQANSELFERYGRVAVTGEPERFETYVDALKTWFSISVYSPQNGYFVAVFDNITARKAHEREIERLTRLYATLSQVNGSVTRVQSREELFEEVCKCVAEHAGFKVAWIGRVDPRTHLVVPVGRAGERVEYLDRIKVYADDRPLGRGPVGTCVREGKPYIVNDFFNDPRTAPWQEPARACGLRAAAALPVRLHGEVFGVFAVYSDEAGIFRDKEVSLLGEIAADISFALEHLEQEEKREHLESEREVALQLLGESEGKYRRLVEGLGREYILFQHDTTGKLTYVSPSVTEMLGYSQDEVKRNYREFLTGAPINAENPRLMELSIQGHPPPYEAEIRHKDGTVRRLEVLERPMLDAAGRTIAVEGIAHDITERKRMEQELRNTAEENRMMMSGTIEAISHVLEVRDPYTAGHDRRVAQLACAIADAIGWEQDRIEGVRVMGYLHDLGKVAVPSEILSKPGRINDFEMGIIKSHPQCGHDILKRIAFPWPVAVVALQHHERLDGSGYPQQLKGDQIVPEARLVAIADVVEAMSSHRPYRAALTTEQALAEVTENPHLYDSLMAETCRRLMTEGLFKFS